MTFWYEIKFRAAQVSLKKAQGKVASLEAEKAAQTTYKQDYDAAAKAWKEAKKKLDAIKRIRRSTPKSSIRKLPKQRKRHERHTKISVEK